MPFFGENQMNKLFTKLLITTSILCLIFACNAKKSESDKAGGKEGNMRSFKIKSPAFADGDSMPVKFTCDGDDVSPKLEWSGAPEGTQSLAFICDDPDAPMGVWVHWVLFNLSPKATKLEGNYAPAKGGNPDDEIYGSMIDGINDFRRLGYNGPCPPKGPAHRYFFKLYALDTMLNLKTGASKGDVEKAMSGHILAKAEMIGKYQRMGDTDK
jgi:hypothetical protein